MKRGALVLLVASAAVLAGAAAAGAQSSGGVLVIGDSLEVGTGPYLRQELRGVAPVTVDARTNSLVIASDRDTLEEIRKLIEKLDK